MIVLDTSAIPAILLEDIPVAMGRHDSSADEADLNPVLVII